MGSPTSSTNEASPVIASPPPSRFNLKNMMGKGLGGTVGGPIFAIVGYAILQAKTGLLVSLLLNGILMLFFIMIFSELALSFPILGGSYSFSKEAIGGVQGFLFGWLIWVGNLLFVALSGLGFALSVAVFLPARYLGPIALTIIGLIAIFGFFWVNVLWPSLLSKILTVLTYMLVFGFVVFIVVGIAGGSMFNPDFSTAILREPMELSGILSMAAYTFVIYCVYEWNSSFESLAAEFDKIKRPRKNIPRAFIMSIVIAIGIYWLVSLTTLLNIGSSDSRAAVQIIGSTAPLADAFGLALGSSIGVYFMALIGMIATITSINAGLQMSARLLRAMARDGFIPSAFKKERRGVHVVAMSLSCGLILIFTVIFDIALITDVSNFIFLVSMVLLVLSLMVLRKTRPNLNRPWKIPLYPFIPVISLIACGILIISMATSASGLVGIASGVIIVVLGGIYYLFRIARRDRLMLLASGSKLGISIVLFLCLIGLDLYLVPAPRPESLVRWPLWVFFGLGIFTFLLDLLPIRKAFLAVVQHKSEAVVVSGLTQLSPRHERGIRALTYVLGSVHIAGSVCAGLLAILVFFPFLGVSSGFFPIAGDLLAQLVGLISLSAAGVFGLNGVILILQEREMARIGRNPST